MLLLQYSPTSLKWEDLREDEKAVINENACGALQFMWVLRHGYCSTIAFQKKKGKRLRVKEVDRYEVCTDRRLCADYFYFSPLAGWRTYFHEKEDDGVDDNYMYRSYDYFSENNDGPQAYHAYKYEEFRDWIRESHKYFAFKDGIMPHFAKHIQYYKPYCFLRTYMKNLPASEFFCKAGYPNFAMSKRLCGMKEDAKKKFLKWIRETDMTSEQLQFANINDIYACAKKGMSMAKFEQYKMKHNVELLLASVGITAFKAKEVLDYMKRNIGISDDDIYRRSWEFDGYKDYLEECKNKGRNMDRKGVVMPLNYRLARQQLFDPKRWTRAFKKKLKDFALELGNELYGNVEIKPLSKTEEFIKMGEYFNNCVGRMGYDNKMSQKQSYIVIVYRDGKPEECVEINPNTKQILQELGKGNCRSQYYSELNPLVIQYANSRQLNLN